MKKYIFTLIILLAVSCSKQHGVEEHTINTKLSDNSIVNEAIKTMEMIYGYGTKSLSKGFSYHNIIPATKSNSDISLHVINFEDNSGFVAFAGNEGNPILLGISNNGNLNIEALEYNLASAEPYYNIIDTPVNEFDDPEDTPYNDSDIISIESSDYTDFINVEFFDLDDGSTDLYFGPVEGLMADNLRFIDGMEEYESMIGDMYPPQNWSEWEDFVIVPSIIRSKWHQSKPYNSSYPIVNGERSGVGCGAIATGQIESFYNIPAHRNWNVISKFDIYTLNSSIQTYRNHSQEDSTIIADYIYELSQDLGADFENNASINIYKIRRYFRNRLGLIDARINNWNWPRAKERIKIGVPVIMSGHGPNGGHAWIIDGYMTQKRENHTYPYQTLYRDLMHINWGHGGPLDGYYFIGNFNKYEGAVGINENDGDRWPVDYNDSTSYYDTNLKILTWSKP